jgi:hypothetical protein
VRFKSHKPAADTFHNVLGIVIVRRIQSTADFSPWVLSSEHVLSLLLPAFASKSGGRQLQLTGMVVKVITQNRSSVSLISLFLCQNLAFLQLRQLAIGRSPFAVSIVQLTPPISLVTPSMIEMLKSAIEDAHEARSVAMKLRSGVFHKCPV